MRARLPLLVAFAALAAGAGPQGQKYEMAFQFDQNGTPSMHTYVLKWNDGTTNLQSIDVKVSDTDEVIQTIQVPQDKVAITYDALLNSKPNEIKEKLVESIDYNFDKYADLRLLRQYPYKVGQKFYLVWIFDEEKNEYVLNDAVSELPGPVPNPKTRRIESTSLGGFGGAEWTKRAWSINPKGKIKVQTKVTQTIKNTERATFMREVHQRIEGELQRICKIIVPAEGKPKRLWGKKWQCEPFLTKEIVGGIPSK